MNGARVHVLAVASAFVLTAASAFAADGDCTTARCQNPTAIAAVRATIAAECDCAGATSGPAYMKCVKRVVKQALSDGTLSRVCKGAVTHCEAAVGCGIGIRPFRTVQQIFGQSCALPSCHSPLARQGGLVLDTEDVSYTSLINRPATNAQVAGSGMSLVVPGDPKASFLIQKLKGTAPGDRMPQSGEPLSKGTIKLIEKWIKRGALPTDQECPPADSPTAKSKKKGRKSCNDRPLRAGTYVWQPQPALPTPEAEGRMGFQMYTPPRDIAPGTEWERCYAFKNIDWLGMAAKAGYLPNRTPIIKAQTYRMHPGSHHLLLYAYYGPNAKDWADGYFPCNAGQCESDNPNDCPKDTGTFMLPIGGTQVAGTRYEVNYPEGVGVPVLSNDMVLIANLHYTNPFQPPQPIYGEAWLNIYFAAPDETKAILNGIFAINYGDLFVEPYQTRTISRVWNPRSLIGGAPVNADVFQLFGHMHKRGTEFQIDVLRGGHCSDTPASGIPRACGRDDDCRCYPGARNCVPDQTCILPPGSEDSTIYYTKAWDRAPVMDFQKPYLVVNKDQGLRWTCTHTNGVEGDPLHPPKKCTPGCEACGWDDATRTCIFQRGVQQGFQSTLHTYQEGEPMPVVFGELADDDMCNMFGYFVIAEDAANLP